MEQFLYDLSTLHFYQALIIVFGVFFSDMAMGIIAALASGRRIRSQIMVACQDKKMQNFFKYIIIGVAFHSAAIMGYFVGAEPLLALDIFAVLIVCIPAIPEIVSIFENLRIIQTKNDTKPKPDSGNQNVK